MLTAADYRQMREARAASKRRFEESGGLPGKEKTLGEWKPRSGSLYWYPLNALEEITVYPLLWGQARLVRGRRDDDSWEIAYDYADRKSAIRAAEDWDGTADPEHGWIKKLEPSEKQTRARDEL